MVDLKERNERYGAAWLTTGEILHWLNSKFVYLGLMVESDYFFSWFMILNKLIRALREPLYKDNWADIIGYATLVLQDIETREALKGAGEHVSDSENV